MKFTKVQITPPASDVVRTGPPRKLECLGSAAVEGMFDRPFPNPGELTEITVLFPPLFMMSRGYSPYRARDVTTFLGYLNSFEPEGCNPAVGPFNECVLTITPEAV